MHMLEIFAPKAMQVIPNFYDESIFYPDVTISKNSVFTFVSIGEPAYIKGLDILLQAFSMVKEKFPDQEMQLVLVDRIPEQAELIRQARSLGIEQQVVWTGLVSQKDIADLLRQSHVLVSASRVETFGKAMIEAQACGLPLVATKTNGAAFIMKDSSQGDLAELQNVQSLMQAMVNVYTGYAQYNPIHIHAMVEQRFSTPVVIRQWMHLYQSIGT
jgi:glycosyltransferase involved in cell wall biosynthesis